MRAAQSPASHLSRYHRRMRTSPPRSVLVLLAVAVSTGGCGDDDTTPTPRDAGSTPRDAGGTPRDAGGADGDGGSTPRDAGGADVDAGSMGGGGAAFRGTVLLEEHFADTDIASRGWYDGRGDGVTMTETAPGGTGGAFACHWTMGAIACENGVPARHAIAPQNAVYLSFWVKHSVGWVGSGRAYHPHLFHFVTNEDDAYVGPSHTHLTAYIEHVQGRGMLALQDSRNVDLACILHNDDTFDGCGGSFSSYAFTEMRSVCACNGIVGDLDGRDCFPNGDGTWYSSRAWRTPSAVFTDSPGPGYESDWHFVEAYFRLNTIEGGVGVPNGAIRYWVDGALSISSDHVLLRTAQFPSMQFNQFLMLPYIGDGSPMDQTMWIDEITVAAGLTP